MHGPSNFIKYAQIEGKARFYHWLLGSYSQGQEDLFLNSLCKDKPTGFYVDIGAADGVKYSNTNYFYLKGWRGINIEPDPRNFSLLVKSRPHDTNLNIGISGCKSTATLYQFSPPVLCTLSSQVAQDFRKRGYKCVGQKTINTDTLANVLDTYASNQVIDFFSVDTEGHDFEILQSNDWQNYLPKFICIELEHSHLPLDGKENNRLHNYLESKGYSQIFDNSINRIYRYFSTR